MKTLILSGGNIEKDFALSFMKIYGADYVIGVDHGLAFCKECDILPDYIVGDFDSLAPEILDWYKSHTQVPIREFNPIKDATDTCIALEHALEKGSEEIVILGATGTRLDHVLCNIQILKRAYLAGVKAALVDSHNYITIPVGNHLSLSRNGQFGKYVSFFPLEEQVEGLTLTGFAYPLHRHCLRNLDGLGVSNEIAADVAEATWESGTLVMIQSRD